MTLNKSERFVLSLLCFWTDREPFDPLEDLVALDFFVDRVLLEEVVDGCFDLPLDDLEPAVNLDRPLLFEVSVNLEVVLDRDEESSSSIYKDLRLDAAER